MKIQSFRKYSKLIIIIGAACLAISVACFVTLGICAGILEDAVGYELSASEAKTMIEQAEVMTKAMGGDVSDLLDVSNLQAFLIKFCTPMRIWMLVLGILLVGAGAALQLIGTESKVAEGITRGVSGASAMVKEVIDKATVKCPKCGKVCGGKTIFCPVCGEKMVKNEPMPRPAKNVVSVKIRCENCGTVYSENKKFCAECGSPLPESKPDFVECSICGAKNSGGAKFCSECGAGLMAVSHPVVTSEKLFEPEDDIYCEREEVKFAERMREEIPEPSCEAEIESYREETKVIRREEEHPVKVVTEKKNPFMSKAKDL